MIDWSQVQLPKTPEEKLALAKSAALAANNQAFEKAIGGIKAAYPPSEIESWEIQRQESKAWSDDPAAPTPWIDIAAQQRGIPRELYLSKTFEKAGQFGLASAVLVGQRQRFEGLINAATTEAEVAAVVLTYSLG